MVTSVKQPENYWLTITQCTDSKTATQLSHQSELLWGHAHD